MPCLLVALAYLFPRLTLILMAVFGYAQSAFGSLLWPILGWVFMPYTTCAYAIAMVSLNGLQGMGLALLILGVILDMGSHGGAAQSTRRGRPRKGSA